MTRLFSAILLVLALPGLALAQVAISALPAGAALGGTEPIPTVQAGVTVKTTPAAISTYIASTLSISSGTFTVTWNTGFTVSQAQDYIWYKAGNIVVLKATSQANGTSNAVTTTTAAGAAPVAIRPQFADTIVNTVVAIQNNGSAVQGCLKVNADGSMAMGIYAGISGNLCGFNTWTASGTKLLGQGSSGVGQTFGVYGVP